MRLILFATAIFSVLCSLPQPPLQPEPHRSDKYSLQIRKMEIEGIITKEELKLFKCVGESLVDADWYPDAQISLMEWNRPWKRRPGSNVGTNLTEIIEFVKQHEEIMLLVGTQMFFPIICPRSYLMYVEITGSTCAANVAAHDRSFVCAREWLRNIKSDLPLKCFDNFSVSSISPQDL